MTVFTGDFLDQAGTATDAFSDYDLNCPIIGIDNVLSASDVAATDTDPDFPITNVINPATHLKWRTTGTTSATITLNANYVKYIDYLGIAAHNLNFGGTISVSFDALCALLHFDGTDTSTTITSDAYYAQTWTAHGNAQLDTAEKKFGTASLLCDGTGDYVDSPDDDRFFNFSNLDFTVDMWVRPNASGALNIAGQVDAAGTANADSAWRLRKTASNFLEAAVVQGTTVTTLTGSTAMSNATWYHVALVRKDDLLYLFLNGVLQQTAAFTGSVNNSTEPMTVGRGGSQTGSEWNGWIDEFHIYASGAIWTSAFTPPTAAWDSTLLASGDLSFDPSEIIVRFPVSTLFDEMTIDLSWSTGDAEIAVIYLGKLLVMERSIKLDPWHTPINFGRRTTVVNGRSESGNFLGRIVLNLYSESKASFQYITQQWYRDFFDDFVIAARETPFFWAWNPTENINDTGYAWLTADPVPEIDPVTRRVAIELEMRGITE